MTAFEEELLLYGGARVIALCVEWSNKSTYQMARSSDVLCYITAFIYLFVHSCCDLDVPLMRSDPFPVTFGRGDFRYPPNNPFLPKQFEPDAVFVTVNTAKGQVVGQVVKLYDGPGKEWDRKQIYHQMPWLPWLNVTVFLGIPYAEPPVKNLRFMVSPRMLWFCRLILPLCTFNLDTAVLRRIVLWGVFGLAGSLMESGVEVRMWWRGLIVLIFQGPFLRKCVLAKVFS